MRNAAGGTVLTLQADTPGIAAVRFTAGKRRTTKRSTASGTPGGQYAKNPGQSKSRRWRDGDSRRDKASGEASGVVQDVTR